MAYKSPTNLAEFRNDNILRERFRYLMNNLLYGNLVKPETNKPVLYVKLIILIVIQQILVLDPYTENICILSNNLEIRYFHSRKETKQEVKIILIV